jgi:hypothetical protein
MLTQLLKAKVAAVAVSTVLGATAVAAAATGSLPGPAQSAVSHGLAHVVVSVPDGNGTPVDPNDAPGKGPNVTTGAADLFGLCHAYAQNSQNAKDHSQAMQALIKAAGGADKVADYCAKVAHPGKDNGKSDREHGQSGNHPGNSDHAATSASNTPPTGGTGTGASASDGANGHGATTANSASNGASTAGAGNASPNGASHRP